MASLLARTGVATATTGTGPITLGAALGAVAPNLAPFMDFAAAGAVNGKTYRYLILDANGAWEIGRSPYQSAGGLLTTRTVKFSSNGNAAIDLSGTAQVFIVPIADDLVSISDDQTAIFSQTEKAQARANVAGAPIEALAANLLNLNAGMEVSQENGTSSVALTGTSSLQTAYIVDGVMAAFRGTFAASGVQSTDAPPGFSNSVKFTVGTAQATIGANDELGVLIPVEGIRCPKLAFGASTANAVAVFFWVKAHRTGTYSASLRNGAKTRSYPFSFSVDASDTWEYKSILIQGDQSGTWALDTSVGLYLNIAIAAGSSRVGAADDWAGADYSGVTSTINGVAATTDTFQVTGVGALPLVAGVSVGDIPDSDHAPFLVRPFDAELSFCRRFWQSSYRYGIRPGTIISDGAVRFLSNGTADVDGIQDSIGLQLIMRVVTTITLFSPITGVSGKIACFEAGVDRAAVVSVTSDRNFSYSIAGGATSKSALHLFHYTANARL